MSVKQTEFNRKIPKKRDCHIGDHVSCPGECHKDGSCKILSRCHKCKWYIVNMR